MEWGSRQAAPSPSQQHVPRSSSYTPHNQGADEATTSREQTKYYILSSDAHDKYFFILDSIQAYEYCLSVFFNWGAPLQELLSEYLPKGALSPRYGSFCASQHILSWESLKELLEQK